MELLWWIVTVLCFAVGLIGTVLPVFPGTTVILAGVGLHRYMLGPEKSVSWWIVGGLGFLTLLSYAVESAAGYFGAKRFGATKWGGAGAIIGGLAGIFFGLPGIFLGPIVGVIVFEFLRGKRLVAAGKAGWGTLLGNLGGMVAKLVIALAMIVIFLMKVPSPL